MPSMDRRTLLAIGGSALPTLAGCTALSSSENLHQIEVQNSSHRFRKFSVSITDEEDSILYEETFTLDAQMMEEDTEPFSGTPAQITITVDGAAPIEADWPAWTTEIRNGSETQHVAEGCGATSGETVTGVFVYIESPEHVVLQPTCGTPQ